MTANGPSAYQYDAPDRISTAGAATFNYAGTQPEPVRVARI
jgi:hypothetical protein